MTVVEEHSRAFVRGLVDSSFVFFTTRYDLWNYRLCNRTPSRTFIRIHHGIITKAYGNLRTKQLERQRRSRSNELSYPSRLMSLSAVGVDAQSIESEVERHFRVTAEGKKPSLFRTFGYPRYDRIRALRSGTATPIVPERSREELENDGASYRFLYAPTHKDGAYETTLFPFDGFDVDRFRDFLAERDAVLYVRMHPLEDDDGIYDEYIDGELIRYAGTTFAQSPIEILPYFDALVTDYSSIYVDFLPFDGPIVFLTDDHEAFLETRGLAFDYDRYFPGEKIDDSEAFFVHLERCLAGEERYEDRRAFVRDTFLPERDDTFLEAVFDEFHSDR
ncbi:CDP-glycerol glycerophosphotransferase family protein [Natrarchaeobius oligotrophus]|uniref:CDP-glycerol glycerophosphotransferase family protein n=1 Tax=Natrarchaeobius oligotrophus TaxID=3455743 RepID=UPI0014051CAD|nr:CDP-glycerol glycerophosphotransferase family protein [Natrarchaeobius chitinivorans]